MSGLAAGSEPAGWRPAEPAGVAYELNLSRALRAGRAILNPSVNRPPISISFFALALHSTAYFDPIPECSIPCSPAPLRTCLCRPWISVSGRLLLLTRTALCPSGDAGIRALLRTLCP